MHLSLTMGLSLSSLNPGAIGCLLKLHSPQGLLIVHVIASGGLEIRLSTQVDPDILEYSGKEAAVGEYSCRALNAGYHMHHHQISHVNSFPSEDRVHNKMPQGRRPRLDVLLVAIRWRNSCDEGLGWAHQAVCRWFAHPLGICKSTQPLNSLSRLESRHSGPRLGLIHLESN